MNKKDVGRLADVERGVCQETSKHLKGSSQKLRRAQMLRKAEADGPGGPEVKRADAFHCRVPTIEHLRARLVTEGVAWALEGPKRREPPTPCQRDGEAEAQGMALRLGKPPAGDGPWTLPRLADALVALASVEAISHETVRTVRKKPA